MRIFSTRTYKVAVVAIVVILLGGGGLVWWKVTYKKPKLAYTSEGYGGFVPAPTKTKGKSQKSPLQTAIDAYNKGDYKGAEAMALSVVESSSNSKSPKKQKEAARAQYILAFSAARQKDMALARDRFAVLKEKAAKLPDKGKQGNMPGVVSPTLEEDAAYQHAICTAALGNKKAAEAEYIQFMRDYPESPLIDASLSRIEKLRDGHLPPQAEAVWNNARKIAQVREKAKQKEQSLCGPECLAELLRRQGIKADVYKLAKEMKTNEDGTSLKALADTAEKHGFSAKGLQLTQHGLVKQPLPLVALIAPGHYVLVEKVTPKEVTIWDANGKGLSKPSTRSYSIKEWTHIWSGIALVLAPRTLNKSE